MTNPAKSPTEKGKDEEVLEPTEAIVEAEQIVTPPLDKGKSKVEPEDFEQKYKSLQGIHDKLKKEHDGLKGQQANIDGVVQKLDGLTQLIGQQETQLNLLIDAVTEGTEYSEEIRGKITEARKTQEVETKRIAEANRAYSEIVAEAGRVDLNLLSEEMKPAKTAWESGKPQEALRLTKIAVGGKISAIVGGKVVPKETEGPDKDRLKQPNLPPTTPTSDEDLTPKQKVMKAQAKLREES